MYFKNFFHKFSKISIFMKIIALAGLLVFESFSKRRTPTVDGMSCRDVCRRVLIFS